MPSSINALDRSKKTPKNSNEGLASKALKTLQQPLDLNPDWLLLTGLCLSINS